MADDYVPYHVPQQSRRDKLRVIAPHNPENLSDAGLHPLYDSGLLQVDFLKQEEGPSYMGLIGGIMNTSSTSSHHHHQQPYDVQPPILMNTNSIQDMNGNSFIYPSQNMRDLDHHHHNHHDHQQQHHQPFTAEGTMMLSFKPQQLDMNHQVSGTCQGLSLSLSTQQATQQLPHEIDLHRYHPAAVFVDHQRVDAGEPPYVGINTAIGSGGARYNAPLGPFTGYESILNASRFLRPAEQLLEEFCDVGQAGAYAADRINDDVRALDPSMDAMSVSGLIDDSFSCGDSRDHQKSRLISMLDEVYRRYKQYYQRLQAVMASFESVAGLSSAAPYANFAVKGMSKNFRSLKNAIMDQLQLVNRKAQGQVSQTRDDKATIFGNHRHTIHNSAGFLEQQPIWRPQRGLPERAVTVLRAWLFDNFLHPYPTDNQKIILAKQTGLSRSQVSNWFINARVRLWKPLVEEIHMLETRQKQKATQSRDECRQNEAVAVVNASTSNKRLVNDSRHYKHEKDDATSDVPMMTEETMTIYDELSNAAAVVTPARVNAGGGAVSLTLGLHQNNVLSDQFSLNAAAQGFDLGLDGGNGRGGYAGIGGFDSQSRHYGRDIMGGQLLHDFVG